MPDDRVVLFVCEKYYLRFYRPLAARLARSGFRPVWVTLDGPDDWDYEYLDTRELVDRLADDPHLHARPNGEALCAFERAVFERPHLFKDNYRYTITVVRTLERAHRLAEVWYRLTLALASRFKPRAILVWNGRYLPYSAVSGACEAAGQPFLTSEIGWLPGTIFLDRGRLAPDTTDLRGREWEATVPDTARADRFLEHYTHSKATMVSQTLVPSAEVRMRLLGIDGRSLLLYGCQVDWDTNVVIGARRFKSNEAAVSFLTDAVAGVDGARVVVKTHPLDSETREDRLRDIVGARGTVISNVHPHTLIEAADCVAVRNSTLGFEALCYGKPVMALEQAKYTHPRLALDAGSLADATAALAGVARGECHLPDPSALRQFILHLLDRYLVPGRYEYLFDPGKLEILSHLAHNDSYQQLEQRLDEARLPDLADADDVVARGLDRCRLQRARAESFLSRQVRRLSGWRH